MLRPPSPDQPATPADRTARPWPLLVLVLLVLALHFTRLDDLTLRGEETRRGQVAVEMMRTGDWIVPRQQGRLFLSRPPLQNWLIAAVGFLRGRIDHVAIRLPSAIATLLTVLLIFAYSRQFLSPLGSFTAAASYATLGQVLELGHLGETESLFTLLVASSLLVWHSGYVRGWPPLRLWSAAYLLVALGTLAKGPQAPAYFAACVGIYLVLDRRVRFAFTPAHLAGIGVFLAVWGAWQAAYTSQVGWHATFAIYTGDVALRFVDMRSSTILAHLLTYPWEIVACLLPWSILLVNFLQPGFRRAIGPARPMVLFLAVCLLVTFPTVWFPPESQSRYFMPLYPCVAPLVGLVVARSLETPAGPRWQKAWDHFVAVFALVMALAGGAVLTLSILRIDPVAQPLPFAAVYFLAAAGLAVLAWRTRRARRGLPAYACVLSVAAFAGLTVCGAYTNALVADSNDIAASVACLRRALPPGSRLVSVGYADHRFAYRLSEPLPYVKWPGTHLPPGTTHVCFVPGYGDPAKLPFAWQPVALISTERTAGKPPAPRNQTIVARLLPHRPPAPTKR